MEIPFNTHTIYVTMDDKNYELKGDYTKVEVSKIPSPSKENHPIMLLCKDQFDLAKGFLLNKENPFKMNKDDAKIYHQIGFITSEELNEFIKV